jgi:hypothetical protein
LQNKLSLAADGDGSWEGGLMSEEKKTSEAKPFDAAARGTGAGDGSDRPRARNQDVLPGILGKQLRAAYGELLNAPVPDAITDLVKRLESQPAAGTGECDADAAEPGKPLREESGQ